MHQDIEIVRIAAEQGGVVTRQQAIDIGFSRHQIHRRLFTERWAVVLAGGYRLVDMQDRLSLTRAACALLPNAAVSHHSAAAFHRLGSVPRDIVSVSVAAMTTHVFPGVRVHRNSDLDEADLISVRGMQTTTIPRTLMDLAGVLTPRRMEYVVDDALASGRCTITELSSTLTSVARRGKPGVQAMRAVLEARTTSDEKRTQLERAGIAALLDGGVGGFEVEYPLPWSTNRRFDVAFPTSCLAIEWDSIRWHTQKRVFQSDRERDRVAAEHGWCVLRFTWDDVTVNPGQVVETIKTVLATRAIA